MWTLRMLGIIVVLVVGGLALLSAVTPLPDAWLRYSLAVSGLVLIGVGGWQLRHPFGGVERRYTLLRGEIEQFLELARRLHQISSAAHAAPNAVCQQAFDEIKASMQVAVERMVTIAHVADRQGIQRADEQVDQRAQPHM